MASPIVSEILKSIEKKNMLDKYHERRDAISVLIEQGTDRERLLLRKYLRRLDSATGKKRRYIIGDIDKLIEKYRGK